LGTGAKVASGMTLPVLVWVTKVTLAVLGQASTLRILGEVVIATTAAGRSKMGSWFSNVYGRGCAVAILVVVTVGCVAAQDAEDAPAQPGMRLSVVQDWSNRHILFTNGGTPETVAATQRDPRSLNNWLSRNAGLLGLGRIPQKASEDDAREEGAREDNAEREDGRGRRGSDFPPRRVKPRNRHSRVDWAMSLGPSGGMPLAEAPAKFTFDINATPSCANDFIVYTISLGNVTAGTGKQANLVAFNNLYSGTGTSLCNRTTPTFLWSYAVGTGGSDLSPAISLDGKKVAFIENNVTTSNRAIFHVVTWATGAGQGTNATAGAVVPNGASSVVSLDYTNITTAGCPANGAKNPNGSPYVDYGNDVVYLTAGNGVLYHVKGVFNGTPTLDYCITVTASASLTSPVYDSVTNKVYVSDGRNVFAYTPGANSFTAAGSLQISSHGGIILSPMVDSTNGVMYVFSSNNSAGTTGTNAIVSQIPLALTSHVDAAIGLKSTFVWVGDFDNAYFNAPSGGSLYACGNQTASGSKPALYTLSFTAAGVMNTTPAMSNNVTFNGATNPNGMCSPLTSFYDGTNDRLFAGVGANGATTGANVMTMFNINARITSNATAPVATAINEIGGTSGITIDNISASPQAASIYFGTLFTSASAPCGANLYCAVKLTQSGLQ